MNRGVRASKKKNTLPGNCDNHTEGFEVIKIGCLIAIDSQKMHMITGKCEE